MAPDQRSEYRQIAAYARLDEAEVARGMLEADGIPVALLDTQVAALGLGPAVGGIRLLVPAWDEARAAELLSHPANWPEGGPSATPTPLPGSLLALTPTPLALALPAPAPAQPGPVILRLAVWVALALAVAASIALR